MSNQNIPANTANANTYLALSSPFEAVTHTAFGHSYIQNGAGLVTGQRYSDRITSRFRTLALVNNGLGGTSAQAIADTVLSKWVPGTRGLVEIVGMINSVHYGNGSASNISAVAASFDAAFAMLSSGAAYAPSATCFAYSGTWAAGIAVGIGTSGTMKSSTVNSYVDVSWNGDACQIIAQLWNTEGGTVTVKNSGTGTVVQTVSTNGYNTDTTTPFIGLIKLVGYGAGNHSVRVTLTAGAFTLVGVLIPHPAPPLIAWYAEGAITYWFGFDVPTYNGYMAQYQTAIAAKAALYANVVPVTAGGGWDTASMITYDGIHPNEKGAAYIASRVVTALNAAATTWSEGLNAQGAAFTDTPVAPTYYVGAQAAPAAPSAVTLSPGSSSLAVTWAAPSNNGSAITDYTVQYRLTGGSGWTTFAHTASTATGQTITGLTNGTSYDVQVAAVNGIGTGAFSSVVAGSPAGALVIDSFDRTDSASVLGTTSDGTKTWTVTSGATWGISSNQAYLASATVSNTTQGTIASIDSAKANHKAQAKMVTAGSTSGNATNIGLAVRVQDGLNFYMAYPRASGGWGIMKCVGGVFSTLGTPVTTPQNNDVIQLDATGSTLTLYVNGTLSYSVTDTTYTTQTKAGLWASGYNTTRIDDFAIY